MDLVTDLQYCPTVTYFAYLHLAETVHLEAHETFQKQTYRNRCTILNGGTPLSLTIPIVHKTRVKTIKEVEIDYTQKWQNQHWRAIQSAYGKAPFFDYYADDLKKEIYTNYTFLFDLNRNILSLCLDSLQLSCIIDETSLYNKEVEAGVLDIRGLIHPKKERAPHKCVAYNQHFGNDFVTDMSILDLLFCEGSNAYNIIIEISTILKNELELREIR